MDPRRTVRCSVTLASALLLLAGCTQIQGLVPAAVSAGMQGKVTREVVAQGSDLLLTPEVIDHVGGWAADLWLKQYRVVQGKPENDLVAKAMNGIIEAAKHSEYASAAEEMNWRVTVVEDSDINAFAVPGGQVIVTTGLTDFTGSNLELLSVALSHEVVHALKRDAATRMSKQLRDEILLAFTGVEAAHHGLSPGATAGVMAAMGFMHHTSETVPFAREQEAEADHGGLLLMGQAKFNPETAVTFWKSRMAHTKTRTPAFLQMHPSDETRITQLQVWMPEALQLFRQPRLGPTTAQIGG